MILKEVQWSVGGILQTILAIGVTLSLFAASAVMRTRAAAPSFSVLALAAVTVPEHGDSRHTSFNQQLFILSNCFVPNFVQSLPRKKKQNNAIVLLKFNRILYLPVELLHNCTGYQVS